MQTTYFSGVTGNAFLDADEVACAICGRPLGYSTDDQPDWPTGPMCGECYQSRQMDDEIEWSQLDDENL